MSIAAFNAARDLNGLRNYRGSVSRAYYAAFSAVTWAVRKRTTSFPAGYEHPPHGQIATCIKKHLTWLSRSERDELKGVMRRLRIARNSADYTAGARFDAATARNAIHDALFVLKRLELI